MDLVVPEKVALRADLPIARRRLPLPRNEAIQIHAQKRRDPRELGGRDRGAAGLELPQLPLGDAGTARDRHLVVSPIRTNFADHFAQALEIHDERESGAEPGAWASQAHRRLVFDIDAARSRIVAALVQRARDVERIGLVIAELVVEHLEPVAEQPDEVLLRVAGA